MSSSASQRNVRVVVQVLLVAEDIEAYDNEAARRYARESIEEVREQLDGDTVALGFADGDERCAVLSLPKNIEPEATLIDGEEEDPKGDMSHAQFEIEVPAAVEFELQVREGSAPAEVAAIAHTLLAGCAAQKGVEWDDGCIGSKLRLVTPIDIAVTAN